ncbi:MAG: hypothetical protein FWE72_02755 [Spirochaetaceae bacterium]|nr:hypothetical protein [Spirochaetaceae bacterium]
MKINIFIILSFISINSLLYAQNFDLKYYSSISDSDYKSNYSGYAVAIYIDKNPDNEYMEFIENKFLSIGRDIDKLTKNNLWLCWKALNEWDIVDGEIYLIFCTDNKYSDNGIMIIATIEDNGKSFSWQGKLISDEDFE